MEDQIFCFALTDCCINGHTTLCVWKMTAVVYLLRWYSVPCRASMSLFPFLLCRLSATRWRSGTLLLRGIKHCIFRLWLTGLLQGLLIQPFFKNVETLWGMMSCCKPRLSGAVKPDFKQRYSALVQRAPKSEFSSSITFIVTIFYVIQFNAASKAHFYNKD